jgi:4-amino-4-deoxy-L-arabinose transferase-like glycosyltransferase
MTITSIAGPDKESSTASQRTSGWLGVAAPVGGIGFTALYTVVGATRQGYDPLRQLISALGAGSTGLALNIGFVVAGLLLILGVIGFARSLGEMTTGRRATIAVLLAFPLLGLIVCGFFHMDTNLMIHTVGAQLACGLPIVTFSIAAGLLRRTARKTSIWLIVSAVLALLALLGYMFLSTTTYTDFSSIAGGGTIGLWERILAIVLFTVAYPSLGIIGAANSRRR